MKTKLLVLIAALVLAIPCFAQNTATGVVTVVVTPAPLVFTTPATLPPATVGSPYTQTIAFTGGTAPVACSITTQTASATIPGCVLTWTPAAAGTFSITVKLTDSTSPTPLTATQVFSLTVTGGAALTIKPVTVTTVASVPWSVQLAATGGVAPYTWAAQAGTSLPTNVSITTAGVLSGVFALPGSIGIKVQVTDSSAPVAHVVNLTWTASASVGVTGVNIYKGASVSGPWTKNNSIPVTVQPYIDSTVKAGETDFYALTAVLSSGQESAYSNIASATVPTP